MNTKYVACDERPWFTANVRGTEMSGATLWNEGYGLSTRVFRMPKGMVITPHKHDVFVQVAILAGRMHIDVGDRTMGPGDIYFVQPGQMHVETALEDCEILVTKQEPDPADSQSRLL
jgi:quercetin dioxygenase-like cupin family protein